MVHKQVSFDLKRALRSVEQLDGQPISVKRKAKLSEYGAGLSLVAQNLADEDCLKNNEMVYILAGTALLLHELGLSPKEEQ